MASRNDGLLLECLEGVDPCGLVGTCGRYDGEMRVWCAGPCSRTTARLHGRDQLEVRHGSQWIGDVMMNSDCELVVDVMQVRLYGAAALQAVLLGSNELERNDVITVS